MRVVIAPDKFKGSLTAPQVAAALAAGVRGAASDVDVVELPVADGGEGTLDAAVAAGFERVRLEVTGPTGQQVPAAFGVRGDAAIVELAEASGLKRLPGGEPAPLTASSRGTGELLRAALDTGCRSIVLGIGGSACTDGGAGMLEALGARVLDARGAPVAPGGAALRDAERLDLSGLDPRLSSVTLVVACDVDNPLLGPSGAAATFGPQKGASEEDVATLEAGLARWASLVGDATAGDAAGRPGAGAAGGVGFAALAVLGARMRPGIELVLDLTGFAQAVAAADLVVTGEGSLDEQSLGGKAPLGVAGAARTHGVPVVAVAGRCTVEPALLAAAGFRAAYALSDLEPDLAASIARAEELLEQVGRRIGREYLAEPDGTA